MVALLLASCGTPRPPEPSPSHPRVGATGPLGTAATPSGAVSPTSTTGATASVAVATPPPAPPPPTNVIVISIDAMRSDMPWNGYPRDIAPNLTALEKQSVSYTRAYALSSYTAMSMGGFLAGRYPGELKRSGYFFSSYPDDELLFPELLSAKGIRTLAAHAHFYFDQKAGFHQGFADYRIVPGITKDNTTDRNITSPKHVKLAIEMLGEPANTSKQFFAWFHFMDPHDLYMKHPGYTSFGKRSRDRYDGEMFFTDAHLAKLLTFIDQQPWAKHTALIITADHGEAFGEHKQSRHGFELWDNLVQVPMFFKLPGVAARRITTPRSHIDLAPTIFALLGVAPHPSFGGTSLLAEIKGEPAPPRDVIIDLPRTSDNFRRRALVHDRYKIIAFGDDFRFQVYDVVDDPGELVNLKHRKRDVYKMMKKRYLERVKTIKDICPKMRHNLKGKRPGREC